MKKHSFILSIIAASLALAACNPNAGQPSKAASGAAAPAASAAAASGASSAPAASAPVVGLETESKQLGYLLGYQFAMSAQLDTLKKSGVDVDTEALIKGINDQMAGTPSQLNEQQIQTAIAGVQKKMDEFAKKQASETAAAGEKYLADNKAKEGVKTTESGLQYKVTKEGTGAQVAKGDLVTVEYEGRLTDGTVFDSTKNHNNQPMDAPVVDGAFIQGWVEGLQLMKEGGEYTLYVPAKLAYGERGQGSIPANSVLVFDIKVNKVQKGEGEKLVKRAQEAQAKQMQQMQQQMQQAQQPAKK